MNRLIPSSSWNQKFFIGAVYLLALTAPLSLVAAQTAAFLIIIFGAWLYIRGFDRTEVSKWGSLFIAGLLVMVLISSYLTDVNTSLPQLKKSWLLLCFFPMAFYSYTYSRTKVIKILIFATSLASLIGAVRFLAGAVDRAAPFSGGYTTMALFEAALIPIAISLWLSEKGRYRHLYMLAVGIMIVGLAMSQTRAGWLGALVAITILLCRKHIEIVIQVIVLSTIAIVVIPGALKTIVHKLTFGDRTEVTTGRNIIWSQGMSQLPEMPFWGYGPSSFKKLMPYELILKTGDPRINSWHSTPLEILLESGYLGLASILGIWIASVIAAWRRFKMSAEGKWLNLSLLAGLIALYLAGLTTNIMRDFMLSALSILLWALVFAKNENISLPE